MGRRVTNSKTDTTLDVSISNLGQAFQSFSTGQSLIPTGNRWPTQGHPIRVIVGEIFGDTVDARIPSGLIEYPELLREQTKKEVNYLRSGIEQKLDTG